MICNITYSTSASNSIRYIEGPAKGRNGRPIPGTEDRSRLIGSHGFGFNVKTKEDVRLATDMLKKDVKLQASRTNRIKNTTLHTSCSWPPGYTPSDDEMMRADKHFAKHLGMDDARRIVWSHKDKHYTHTHTVWGKVNPDTGYAYKSDRLHERSTHAALEWERLNKQIPPSRQKEHAVADTTRGTPDYDKMRDVLGKKDAPIRRMDIDRALYTGGHFDKDKAKHRDGFIKHNGLTKFQTRRVQSYSSPALAREKQDYVKENRKHSSDLFKANARETKEKSRSVSDMFKAHAKERDDKMSTRERYDGEATRDDVLTAKRAGIFHKEARQAVGDAARDLKEMAKGILPGKGGVDGPPSDPPARPPKDISFRDKLRSYLKDVKPQHREMEKGKGREL